MSSDRRKPGAASSFLSFPNSRGPTARGMCAAFLRGPLAPGCFVWIVVLLASGCQQKMADQPSYKQLEPCEFFEDGRSERPAVPGTVARGCLQTDVALWTGRRTDKNGLPLGATTPTTIQPPPNSSQEAKAQKSQYDNFVGEFPFPMTKEVLNRGYERYMIYCVVCHDPLGTGNGTIVNRGYTQPPSLHSERLRTVPPGYLFAVISNGYGSMPSYAAQIPLRDRWAIAGYLRVLQASQHFSEARNSPLPLGERQKNSPLPLGEGPGVRAESGKTARNSVRGPVTRSPHPNPLPKGEGTGEPNAAPSEENRHE